jgi:hypothetical protein
MANRFKRNYFGDGKYLTFAKDEIAVAVFDSFGRNFFDFLLKTNVVNTKKVAVEYLGRKFYSSLDLSARKIRLVDI